MSTKMIYEMNYGYNFIEELSSDDEVLNKTSFLIDEDKEFRMMKKKLKDAER